MDTSEATGQWSPGQSPNTRSYSCRVPPIPLDGVLYSAGNPTSDVRTVFGVLEYTLSAFTRTLEGIYGTPIATAAKEFNGAISSALEKGGLAGLAASGRKQASESPPGFVAESEGEAENQEGVR